MSELKKIAVDELEFDCRVAGDPAHPLIMFLHGFPETSHMWRPLLDHMANLGYYCVAPDLRGYSEEAAPKGVKHYHVRFLRQDVLNIASALDKDQFHLVGHDWGALIGWNLIHHYADRILSWSALSVPHTSAFGKAWNQDKVQRKKVRYMSFFMLPSIPELYLRRNDFALFRRLWKHSSSDEIDQYLSVFRKKGVLTAALNYYRANFGRKNRERIDPVEVPTLFIWGNRDLAIGELAARLNEDYVKGAYTFCEVNGGHWLMQTNHEDVQKAVARHIQENS